MKKIIIVCLTLLLFSCAGVRKTTDKNSVTKESEKTELVTDSTKTTEINKEIANALKILATKSDLPDDELNRIIDAKVDEILAKMNIQGQSGDNSYSLEYDRLKRELQLQMKVGETKNSEQSVNKSEKTERSFEQQTDEYFSKKVSAIPWWMYVAAGVWFLPQILDRVKMIINPIQGLLKK